MALLNFSSSPHGGRVRLLPESATSALITPKLFILHSPVGSSLDGVYNYFRYSTNLESTFGIGLNGYIEQWMNTLRKADANYRANPLAISAEIMDNGDPDNFRFTAAQVDSIVWLAHELHRIHGIPLVRAPDCDGPGIGYHTMWGAPSCWTPVSKTCPGRARIAQFPEVLRRIQQGDTMPDQAYFDREFQNLVNYFDTIINGREVARTRQPIRGPQGAVDVSLNNAHNKLDALASRPPLSEADINELATAIAAVINLSVKCDLDEVAVAEAVTNLIAIRLAP